MRLTVEIESDGGASSLAMATIPNEGATLVAFMSFAVLRGFGAVHPMLTLAERVAAGGVRMGPLSTFYDATVEDAEDRERLEHAWQEAAPLAEALGGLAAALRDDPEAAAAALRAGAADLLAEVEALRPMVSDAAAAGRIVRLSYTL